jgi:hypothetical protein
MTRIRFEGFGHLENPSSGEFQGFRLSRNSRGTPRTASM